MIRKISRKETRLRRAESKGDNACDVLEVKDLVDLAVDILAEYGVNEIEYEEGEEPDENEAICADSEGNEVGVEVEDGQIKIDLDEEEDIIIKLDQPVEDVKAELKGDLDSKLKDQVEAEECNRRFEEWKRNRTTSSNKRVRRAR